MSMHYRKNSVYIYKITMACMMFFTCLISIARATPDDVQFNPDGTCNVAANAVPVTKSIIINHLFDFTISAEGAAGASYTYRYFINPSYNDSPPSNPSETCSGSDPVVCNNITIQNIATGPASSNTPAHLTGTATSGGHDSFTFTYRAFSQGATTPTSCNRQYSFSFIEPFDMVFVLDHSGSMGWTDGVSIPATTRWQVLTSSVIGFINPHIIDASFTTDMPPVSTGSRYGLTIFSTNVDTPAALAPVTNTLDADIAPLLVPTPAGWTNMGAGLQQAISQLSDATRPRVIMLFTDGEQNQLPYIDAGPAGAFFNTTHRPTDAGYVKCVSDAPANCDAVNPDIKIITVAIGNPDTEYLETLQYLSALGAPDHNGYSIITSNATSYDWNPVSGGPMASIAAAFENAVSPTLSGNSPQMVMNTRGKLVVNQTNTLPAFKLNQYVSNLVFNVSYDRNFRKVNGAPNSQLTALYNAIQIQKDGVDIKPYFKLVSSAGSIANGITLKTNFRQDAMPPLNPVGEYTVKMATTSNIEDINFRFNAYADDHFLGMDWQVTPTIPRVTQSFKPEMTLSWEGKPIESANVVVNIFKPGDELGKLLAEYAKKIDPSNKADADNIGVLKYLEAMKDPAFVDKLLPSAQSLTLTHQGNGRYEASYDPGKISGVYQLVYRVSYDSPETGPVQRLAVQSVYVRFGDMDLGNSQISTTVIPKTAKNDSQVVINMKPKTNVGYLIGPAQQNAFTFTGGSGLNFTSMTDNQDGSYTAVLTGNPKSDISINLLGEKIYAGPAQDFGKGGTGLPSWLIWLLFLLLILILIWVILRFLLRGNSP